MRSKAIAPVEAVGKTVARSVQEAAATLLTGEVQGGRLTRVTLPEGWTRPDGCGSDRSRSRERVRLNDFPQSLLSGGGSSLSCPRDVGRHKRRPGAAMVLLAQDAASMPALPRTARTNTDAPGKISGSSAAHSLGAPKKLRKGHTASGTGLAAAGTSSGGEGKKNLKVIKIPRLRPKLFNTVPHDIAISAMAGCAALWHLVHFAVVVSKIFVRLQPNAVKADLIVEPLAIVSLTGLAVTVWLPFKNTLKATLVMAAAAFVGCLQFILFILHSMNADHFRKGMNAADIETGKILAGQNENKTVKAESMKSVGDSYSTAFGITVWDALLIVCCTPPLLYAAYDYWNVLSHSKGKARAVKK